MERNADACTIYCCSYDTTTLVNDIESSLEISVTPLTNEAQLKQLKIGATGRELIFTFVPFTQPQDPFSKSLLGFVNFIRTIKTGVKDNQSKLISRLSQCRLLIGVKAPSGFDAEAKHIEAILLAAFVMDGYIFTGNAILSAEGSVLLAEDGNYE